MFRHRQISLTRQFDFLLGLFGYLLLRFDLFGDFLRRRKNLNGRFILEKITLDEPSLLSESLSTTTTTYRRRGENFENRVFDLFLFTLVLGRLKNERVLLLFQFGLLFGSDNAQQLILQTFGSDHEIDQGHLHRCFRQIVRIAQFRSDVESKVTRIFDDVLAEFQILGVNRAVDVVSSHTSHSPLLLAV